MIYKHRKQERIDGHSKFRRGKYCYTYVPELLVELINELYATLEVLAILLNRVIPFKLNSQDISRY